jgi:hypothetical protein
VPRSVSLRSSRFAIGLDRGVTKPLPNDLWVLSVSKEKYHVGVAEMGPLACVTREERLRFSRIVSGRVPYLEERARP